MTRLDHWDAIEQKAKALLDEMNRAAKSMLWTDADVMRWDEFHTALENRPRLNIVERLYPECHSQNKSSSAKPE